MKSRFKSLLNELNMSQIEFAQTFGMAKSTVSEVSSGRIRTLPPDVLTKLHTEYFINLNWLLTGEGEMYLSKGGSGNISSRGSGNINMTGGGISGGVNINSHNHTTNLYSVYENKDESWLVFFLNSDKKAEIIRAIKKILGIGIVVAGFIGVLWKCG